MICLYAHGADCASVGQARGIAVDTGIKNTKQKYDGNASVASLAKKQLRASVARLVPDANVIWSDDAMRRFDSADIAIAVATEGGIVHAGDSRCRQAVSDRD